MPPAACCSNAFQKYSFFYSRIKRQKSINRMPARHRNRDNSMWVPPIKDLILRIRRYQESILRSVNISSFGQKGYTFCLSRKQKYQVFKKSALYFVKRTDFCNVRIGRSDRIRTCGLLVPNQAHYQTVPHPDEIVVILFCCPVRLVRGPNRRAAVLRREASHVPCCATPRWDCCYTFLWR